MKGFVAPKPNNKEEHISWAKLDAVLIETTDQGPILPDVFWLLITKDMSSGCVIPQGATGEDRLLEVLQKRLPGFNSEMVIKAKTSTDNQRFLVWDFAAREDIDGDRIGMIGLSYGGFYTLFAAALDVRIGAAVSSCFFNNRKMYDFVDWVWFNAANQFMDAEVGALVCPRPLYVEVVRWRVRTQCCFG